MSSPVPPATNADPIPTQSWTLTFSKFNLEAYNLLEAPPAPTPPANEDEEELKFMDPVLIEKNKGLSANETLNVNFPSYAFFNTGYPFLGVDEYVSSMLIKDLKFYRPDVKCDYDPTYNKWSICYWQDICAPDTFGDANFTFSFGNNATFVLPLSQMMINYTESARDCCAVAIQTIYNMPYDTSVERHFYFGDIFFKSFVGVFDM